MLRRNSAWTLCPYSSSHLVSESGGARTGESARSLGFGPRERRRSGYGRSRRRSKLGQSGEPGRCEFAQTNLGLAYLRGDSPPVDATEAVVRLRKGLGTDDTAAQFTLGRRYEVGNLDSAFATPPLSCLA